MQMESKKELDGSDNSETAELFLQDMIDLQHQQLIQNQHMSQAHQARNQHLEELLGQQQQLALSMTLPKVEVPTFGGDPINYSQFIRSFETLVENKTASSSTKLSYLIQYTFGWMRRISLNRSPASLGLKIPGTIQRDSPHQGCKRPS